MNRVGMRTTIVLASMGWSVTAYAEDPYAQGPVMGEASGGGAEIASGEGQHRFGGHVGLAFGGEAEVEGGGGSIDYDMETTFGFGAEYEYLLLPFLTVGGAIDMTWWSVDDVDGTNMYVDIMPFAKLRYGLMENRMEIFARLKLGLTIPSLDEETIDPSVGFVVNVMGGAAYEVVPNIHLFGELGWTGHFYSVEVEGYTSDGDASTGQFALNFGALYEI